VIAVFTKHDLLKSSQEKDVTDQRASNKWSDEEFDRRLDEAADRACKALCEEPLKRALGGREFPCAAVSMHDKRRLAALIQLTSDHARERVGEAVSLAWAVAQRANVDLNVEGSIQIGKKTYWRGLASSFYFQKKRLDKCLDDIHEGIVTVWNFLDPHVLLRGEDFKSSLLELVEKLRDTNLPDPKQALTYGTAAASAVGGIVGGLSGPAAPIVVPIIATGVIGKWLYDVYKQTPGIVRVMMAYIVDLTAILECLFVLVQAQGGEGPQPVTRDLVDLTLTAYGESDSKAQCHHEIKEFVKNTNIFQRGHKDKVLDKVIELIRTHRFQPGRDLKDKAHELGTKRK